MVDRLTVAECFWSVEMWLVRCECIGNEAACFMTGMWKTVEDPGFYCLLQEHNSKH